MDIQMNIINGGIISNEIKTGWSGEQVNQIWSLQIFSKQEEKWRLIKQEKLTDKDKLLPDSLRVPE